MGAPGHRRFGPFVLDPATYRLTRDGAPMALSPKALDLLFLFAERPGLLLTKDAIFTELWPDVTVTDNALTQVVSEIREALGDQPASPQFVETVPRRGYRFIAEVVAPQEPGRPAPASGVRAIAIKPFANVTGDADLAWLSAGIAETIATDLRAIRDLAVTDTAAPDVTVTGSFQHASGQLRITAQAVRVATDETLARAKADGPIGDVFRLQDAIVAELSAGLRLTVTEAAAARMQTRETSSLEAYRLVTQGRLELETLDPAEVPAALASFERAIALDPSYAAAYVGRAHARFWQFQASRISHRPDREALAQAIGDGRRAVEIDPELAEGHAALALFLWAADRPREAVAAGRVATALEPANWRHQFRLGTAAWGDERLRCFARVVSAYPQLAYTHFGIAMVHVARRDLAEARARLQAGIAREADRPGDARFPGYGLHWLLGMTALVEGDLAGASAAFDRELARPARGLHANEFAMDACDGHGFARLAAGDAPGAVLMFTRALERYPEHARSLVGLAAAHGQAGDRAAAAASLTRARAAIEDLERQDRRTEAAMASAFAHAIARNPDRAIGTLETLLASAPPGPSGWTLPVEPLLATLRGTPAFDAVLARLAERAK
jgi:DNA-binding winged helix-turn-helix (wHTH) protein/tetratricopeptide (TPR) repeat protein